MSKTKRAEATAQAMIEASQEAATVIEACENKHQLKKQEALDVLNGCVVNYLMKDGETDLKRIRKRLDEFVSSLGDFLTDIYGSDLWETDEV